MYYYFQCEKVGEPLSFLSSANNLRPTKTRKKADVDDKMTKLYIKYVNCCFINKDGDIDFDKVKLLSLRLNEFKKILDRKLLELRKYLVEAYALNEDTIVKEISEDIKDLADCLNKDFSSIDNIEDLDNLSIPELSFDYYTHYNNKLYNV